MKPDFQKTKIVVVGGGIVGLSVAGELAARGFRHVTLLERENSIGAHASGRNAGMIRHAIEDLDAAQLILKHRSFFKSQPRGFDDFQFRQNGSLLLIDEAEIAKWTPIFHHLNQMGLKARWLSRSESLSRVNVLSGGRFTKAVFSKEDGFIDINAYLEAFRKRALENGVIIRRGREVRSIVKRLGAFQIRTSDGLIQADILVNASGAWAGKIGELAGANRIRFTSYKRHLYETTRVSRNISKWPFVWDVSHGVYFRPMADMLLLCPCDEEKDSSLLSLTNPKTRSVLDQKVARYFPQLKNIPIAAGKAGLRTFSPDRRFVIGWDLKLDGFLWVAGLGGHGMTAAPSVGSFAADILIGKQKELGLRKAFSPERFKVNKDASRHLRYNQV